MTDPGKLLLLSPQECGALDRLAAQTVPMRVLMERAGWAVARQIRMRVKPCRVLVLCGPGNNGGDGYVVARRLAEAGWPVSVAALVQPTEGSLCAEVAAEWHGPNVSFSEDEVTRADLVVDAIFGAGQNRAPDAHVTAILSAAREIVAVDILTGIDGETGAVLADVPSARLTVTFVRLKPGHLLSPGRERLGETVCADIGIADPLVDALGARTWRNEPGLWRVPPMTTQSHKYSRGVVSICGGGVMPGATRLAAGAARAAGAGLVQISAGDHASAYRLGAPGLVVDAEPLSTLLEDSRRLVWVCGPGLVAEEVARALPHLLKVGKTVIGDAGALGWADGDPGRLSGVAAITPHAGEFARLFGPPGDDRPAAARCAARQLGAVVVLKGADTVIAAPDGRVAINVHASPALATAGSGDTLTGVIAALVAGGMSVWEGCCAGVWIHGEAGMCAGDWPIAEDLDRHLGAARATAIRLSA